MISLLIQYYTIYSYMIFSLVPTDSFWVVRPLFQLILSLIFLLFALLLKKSGKFIKLIVISILNISACLLIGEFAKINIFPSLLIAFTSTLLIVLIIKFRISQIVFISITLAILTHSINMADSDEKLSIYTYGVNSHYSKDSSHLYNGKKGLSELYNRFQWGFNTELPLRGRYALPDNKSPSPIVFILHGNHLSEEDSHKGYDYLIEELTGRGYITASIDQNYLNGDWTNLGVGYPEENDVRAFVLSSTIDLFQELNSKESSPLYKRVDFSHISVIGHSRGGEAGAIAASTDLRIKCLIALAPTYGQYSGRVKLNNIDYFVIQGANDGDLRYFRGYQQFKRTFKSNKVSLLIKGFNHSGFNTDWGFYDGTGPGAIYYSKKLNFSPKKQQTITKELVSNFIDYSYKKKSLSINTILHPYHFTLNRVYKSDLKLMGSRMQYKNSVINLTRNKEAGNSINFSIYNPSDIESKIEIEDDLGNRYTLKVKPKTEWRFLRFKVLEKKVTRDRNPHTYSISLDNNWSSIKIKNIDSDLYLESISTSHQKREL